MDQVEADVHFVERSESVMNSPQPRQLTFTRTTGSVRSSFSVVNTCFQSSSSTSELDIKSTSVVTSDLQIRSELNRSISGEHQRSEVKVEVDGIRETTLSTSENVISSRVKTVYGRSSSGSTSSLDLDHKELLDSIPAGADSAFGVEGTEGLLGSERRERKISDSYCIQQTYQIGSAESSSLSVTAIQNVTFKSSKDLEIAGHGKLGPGEGSQYVERVEEIIPGDHPNTLGSPEEKKSIQFAWYGTNQSDVDSAEKLKSARENVQQLIENSYMVSDISSVIDNDCMGPDTQRLDNASESSVDELSTQVSRVLQTSNLISKKTAVQSTSTVDATVLPSTPPSRPGDLSVVSSNHISPDRESPPRLTYSPGIAIRSYALEELAEKKSRRTPDRLEAVVKSSRFDEESSQVDIDNGSSVDELPSGQMKPQLKKTDFSHIQSGKHSELSVRTSSTQEVGIFKLTKVQKVTLSDDPLLISPSEQSQPRDAPDGHHTYIEESSKEEEDEMLDKLVDLESIQVGYRFHDVGMMQDIGGICNMGFDDSDESELSLPIYSTDQSVSSLPSEGTTNIQVFGNLHSTYSASEAVSHTLIPGSDQTWQTVGSSPQRSEQSSLYLSGSTEISSIQIGQGATEIYSHVLQSQSHLGVLTPDDHEHTKLKQEDICSQESSLCVSGHVEAVVTATGAKGQHYDVAIQGQPAQLEQPNVDQQDSLGNKDQSGLEQSVLQNSGSVESVLNALGSFQAATVSTSILQSETNRLVGRETQDKTLVENKADEEVKGDGEIQIKETNEGGRIIDEEVTPQTDAKAAIVAEDADSQLSINEFKLRQTQFSNTGTIQVEAQHLNSQSWSPTENVKVTKTVEQPNHSLDKTEIPFRNAKSKSKKSKQKSRAHLEKENEAVTKVVKEAGHPVEVSELSLNQVSDTDLNISRTVQASEDKVTSGKQDNIELTNKDAGDGSQNAGVEVKAMNEQTLDKSVNKTGADNHSVDHHTSDKHTPVPGSKSKGKGKNKKNKGKTDTQTQGKEAVSVAHVKKGEDIPTKAKSKHSKHKKHHEKSVVSEGSSQIAESDQRVEEVQSTEQVTVSNIIVSTGTDCVQQGASLTGNLSLVTAVKDEQQGKAIVQTEQRDRGSQVSSSEQVTINKEIGSIAITDILQGTSIQTSVPSKEREVLLETEQINRVSQELSSEQVTIGKKLGSIATTDIGQGASLQLSLLTEQQGKVLLETEQRDRVSQSSNEVTISSKQGSTGTSDIEQGASIQTTVLSNEERIVIAESELRARVSQSSEEVTISNKFESNISADVQIGTLLQSSENNSRVLVESEHSETSGQVSTTEHVIARKLRQSTTTTTTGQPVLLQTLGDQEQVKQQDQETKIKAENQTKTISVTRTTPPRPYVHVSRRFNVNKKFESVLKSLGAVLNSETLTLDVYYDTSDFNLTLADCWLRTHNGKWQLHANFSRLLNTKTKDEFFESEDPGVIFTTLKRILRSSPQLESGASVALFVKKSGLKEFVRYRTVRKTYSLTDVTVDLEMPEYGFWVGNITASVQGRSNDAVNTIYTFWKKTGVEALSLLKD